MSIWGVTGVAQDKGLGLPWQAAKRCVVVTTAMVGVLNETTKTVHRHKDAETNLEARCGATYHLNPDQLRKTTISEAISVYSADKCGRCFEDGGGY